MHEGIFRRKGGEYPYVLAVLAVVLACTGAGAWSLDGLLSALYPQLAHFLGGPAVGIAVTVLAGASAAVFLRIVLHRRPAGQPA